jgi:hypothetical protein
MNDIARPLVDLMLLGGVLLLWWHWIAPALFGNKSADC